MQAKIVGFFKIQVQASLYNLAIIIYKEKINLDRPSLTLPIFVQAF
jgi:hypothetical protein